MLPYLDLFGIAVFAASGALAATRARQTFVTAAFFALVTGVGGGSVRDLLIGAPVFWMHDPWVAAVCLGVAALIWVTPQRWWAGKALDWFDAVGLAAYAVFGAAKALDLRHPAGARGADGGGDGVRRRDHPRRAGGRAVDPDAARAYVTAAALAAGLYVALHGGGRAAVRRRGMAAVAGFALRAAAIAWRLRLPAYRGLSLGSSSQPSACAPAVNTPRSGARMAQAHQLHPRQRRRRAIGDPPRPQVADRRDRPSSCWMYVDRLARRHFQFGRVVEGDMPPHVAAPAGGPRRAAPAGPPARSRA